MNVETVRPLWLVVLFGVGLFSCVSGKKIRAEADVLQSEIERARRTGAMRCAPRELATAEANLEFARGELSQGASGRAEEHIQASEGAVRQALELAKGCAPKQVVVKEKPVVVRIQETDLDADGLSDNQDPCPEQPEDKDGFQDEDGCPDLDNDSDGVPDTEDKCPLVAEDKDGFQDEDGCPEADNDHDGLLDAADKCPTEAGPPTAYGCPDRDGDTVTDNVDRCPDEAGVVEEQGCPKVYKTIVVKKDKIEIKQQIKFATSSARIVGAPSRTVLGEVAMALRDNPRIRKLRIEGHTDAVGKDETNLTLSQKRADAVRLELLKAGIDPARLEAVGYGETKPIASNETASGRAENRRTEFIVVESD